MVAIGGMGKSALTWKWFRKIAPQEMNLAGRLWWSFYEPDASFESFLNRALSYVNGQHEHDVRHLPWADREALLLQQLDEKPFLFVLGGLERILQAYHRVDASYLADDEQTANGLAAAEGLPAAAAQSFIGQHRLRQTIDVRAGRFLQRLAQVRASRILISTRLYPSDLQTGHGSPAPGCFAHFLPGLSDDDALELWRALGVSGSRTELTPIFGSVEGHPLLVQALASEVANYRKAPGDFTKWRADHPDFDPATLPLMRSRTHILQFALEGLAGDIREVLRNIVAFQMPAHFDTLEALLVGADKTYRSVQGLDGALAKLEDRGLIGWDKEANRYDAHAIVRGVVWQQTSSKDQRAVYSALEAYFEPMSTPDFDFVESLEDLAPAVERYHTLVGLERYGDALSLFRDKLSKATLWRLAAYRERIAWLERLFPNGVDSLPALTSDDDQAYSLSALAQSYQMAGQPARSVPLLRRNTEMRRQQSDVDNQKVGLGNLGMALRETGALREGVGVLLHALALSRGSGDTFREAISLEELGRILSTRGDQPQSHETLRRSLHLFEQAKALQAEGVVRCYLAERWFWMGDVAKALDEADQALTLAAERKVKRDLIGAFLLRGRIMLSLDDFEVADRILHGAVEKARAVNLVESELPALIAIADLWRRRGNLSEARTRLDEVWEAAEVGPYPLHQADAYNLLAEIVWTEGDKGAAIEAATSAYRAAWCDGPPYAYDWGLRKAKVHLKTFGAPEPDMPPFDESEFEPMPEVEINPKDDYWIDPATFD